MVSKSRGTNSSFRTIKSISFKIMVAALRGRRCLHSRSLFVRHLPSTMLHRWPRWAGADTKRNQWGKLPVFVT